MRTQERTNTLVPEAAPRTWQQSIWRRSGASSCATSLHESRVSRRETGEAQQGASSKTADQSVSECTEALFFEKAPPKMPELQYA